MTYINKLQSEGTLVFLLFSFTSFEFLFQDKACFLEERMLADRRFLLRSRMSRILFLFPAVLIVGGTVLAYCVAAASAAGALNRMVLVHIVLSCLLNIVFVAWIAVLFGAVLASALQRPSAYLAVIVASFLISPAAKSWFGMLSLPVNALENIDLVRIFDFFSITTPDTGWCPDLVYGLPIEACRWALSIFWSALLFALFLYINRPRRQKNISS